MSTTFKARSLKALVTGMTFVLMASNAHAGIKAKNKTPSPVTVESPSILDGTLKTGKSVLSAFAVAVSCPFMTMDLGLYKMVSIVSSDHRGTSRAPAGEREATKSIAARHGVVSAWTDACVTQPKEIRDLAKQGAKEILAGGKKLFSSNGS